MDAYQVDTRAHARRHARAHTGYRGWRPTWCKALPVPFPPSFANSQNCDPMHAHVKVDAARASRAWLIKNISTQHFEARGTRSPPPICLPIRRAYSWQLPRWIASDAGFNFAGISPEVGEDEKKGVAGWRDTRARRLATRTREAGEVPPVCRVNSRYGRFV